MGVQGKGRCWCGSGKKLKNCHRVERPRTTHLTYGFDRPVKPDGIRLNRLNGSVEFWKDGKILQPQKAVLETSYSRLKGPKVVNRVTFQPEDTPSLMLPTALSRFERLFAIDTNSSDGPRGRISVGIVNCGEAISLGKGRSLVSYEVRGGFEFRNVVGNPERYAWRTLISHLSKASDIPPNSRIGIITDSELGLMSLINTRCLPVCDDYFLPPRFEFVYASGDTQADSFINQMLHVSDRFASEMVREIAQERIPDELLFAVKELPFSHFRVWSRSDDPDDARFRALDPRAKRDSQFRPVVW